MGVDQIGRSIGWGEAIRLVVTLSNDTTSHLAVALAGWQYPMSREAMILADLFDVQLGTKSKKKPPPYPRAWDRDNKTTTKRHGNTGGRSRAEVVTILNAHGHNLPV